MHDEYRLTDADEDRMRVAIDQAVRAWDRHAPTGRHTISGTDREALRRIAAHAMGCSLLDLRDVEVQWIDNEIGEQEYREVTR